MDGSIGVTLRSTAAHRRKCLWSSIHGFGTWSKTYVIHSQVHSPAVYGV
jgi:hypothetical protein